MPQQANGWSKFVALAGLFFTFTSLLAWVAREVAEKLDQRIGRLESAHNQNVESQSRKIQELVTRNYDVLRTEASQGRAALDAELARIDNEEIGDLHKLRNTDVETITELRERMARLEEAVEWIKTGRRGEPQHDP